MAFVIITKYFKHVCLVSQAGSPALREVKAPLLLKVLLDKYFILDEGESGHRGSLVQGNQEPPALGMPRSRRAAAFRGFRVPPHPCWRPGHPRLLTLVSADWEPPGPWLPAPEHFVGRTPALMGQSGERSERKGTLVWSQIPSSVLATLTFSFHLRASL